MEYLIVLVCCLEAIAVLACIGKQLQRPCDLGLDDMYDCSGNDDHWDDPEVQRMADHALLIPDPSKVAPNLGGGLIDFKKYENWLRIMPLGHAANLLQLLGYKWDTLYVVKNKIMLQTTLAALSFEPQFLAKRPRNIACTFAGGPHRGDALYRSSILNFIVDRIYTHIVTKGVEATDAKIVQALNFKDHLVVEGVASA